MSHANLEDYGHIFSNVAYIISGFFFIFICYMRWVISKYNLFQLKVADLTTRLC